MYKRNMCKYDSFFSVVVIKPKRYNQKHPERFKEPYLRKKNGNYKSFKYITTIQETIK